METHFSLRGIRVIVHFNLCLVVLLLEREFFLGILENFLVNYCV